MEGSESSGRFFLCAGCRTQVIICRHCDRGQIYCAGQCAPAARHRSVREASRRYQSSRQGRLKHAERSRRYRARRNNVTHQGSLAAPPDVLLAANSTTCVEAAAKTVATAPATGQCHFCGRPCAALVRTGPLRRRAPRNHRIGAQGDRSP